MVKREIKNRKKVIIVYYVYCPKCNKEIKGRSTEQVEYNLASHLSKHKRDNKK